MISVTNFVKQPMYLLVITDTYCHRVGKNSIPRSFSFRDGPPLPLPTPLYPSPPVPGGLSYGGHKNFYGVLKVLFTNLL